MSEGSDSSSSEVVIAGGTRAGGGDGTVLDRGAHSVSRKDIPEYVLKVLYRLHRGGYRAYLCGGSVRDLLMDRTPKDFDIATDAHPLDVRRLFRNSRIIGRRFRLVHVLFQDTVVEVSTFRREPERIPEEADLLVTDDNTFGTPLEDARRRDFTINGMFYNIADFTVIDHVGGIPDLREGLVRVIGNPDIRFREDPVRMLRAVEFASRLDFEIEQNTYDAVVRHAPEIMKASPARVTEELLELLRRGWARDAFELLAEIGLLEQLLPELERTLRDGSAEYFWTMLEVLDRTVAAGRKVSDAVLLAVLLIPYVMKEVENDQARRGTRLRTGDVVLFIRELIQPVCQRMVLAAGIRHHLEQALDALWRLLEPPLDKRVMMRFVLREQFTDGFALFELYALSSGNHVEVFRQWQGFAQRAKKHEGDLPPAIRRRRRRRKPRSQPT